MQDPYDKENQLFEGKESKFLEASLALFSDATSEFYNQLDHLVFKNIPINAADFAEKTEAAKEELSSA